MEGREVAGLGVGKDNGAAAGRPAADLESRQRIAEGIRKYRKRSGMDQAALAEKLGLAKTAVGNWELGLSRPGLDTLPKLCRVLGLPVSELLGMRSEEALAWEDRLVFETYHQLEPQNQRAIQMAMGRMLILQDRAEALRLRESYCRLYLYEEAAAAGFASPMNEDAGAEAVYAARKAVPGGADMIIRVNGRSMEPTYPDGCLVYVNSRERAEYGQTGIFLVNNEAFIKEYQPEGLVSHNRRYQTIRISSGTEVRCAGRVTGIVGADDLARGPLAGKIAKAFSEA